MKKVFLYAYDKQNLGDDLFVHMITKRYPKTKFYIWTEAYNKSTFASLKNLKVINKDSTILRSLDKLHPTLSHKYKTRKEERCDAVVFIGGSIFIEYESWRQSLTWWDYEVKHRNFYVLGANFGPYKSEDFKEQMGEVFRNMKDVCFRDKYSYELFSDIPTVRYAPDILLGINMPKRKSFKKSVFVSVIDCSTKGEGINQLSDYEKDYQSALVSIIKASLKNEYGVVLSSFCKIEGDEAAIDKALSMLSKEEKASVSVINYNSTNSDEVLQAISDSDMVAASRFHAMILGFAADKPVFPIVYSDKTLNVLEDIGFKGEYWDLRSMEKVNPHIFFEKSPKQVLSGKDEIIKKSANHFDALTITISK